MTSTNATPMFCHQCQETLGNAGCTRMGVCGKRPETARMMDELVAALEEIAATHDPTQGLGRFASQALFMTLTNANFDDGRFAGTMRFGEDVDFSYRIVEGGHTSRLFPDAWVWHKRRANFRQFFKQVHNSGIARINLTKRHPGTLKLVHMLPAVFTVGVALCLAALLVGLTGGGLTAWAAPWLWLLVIGLCPLLLFSLIILIDATARNRSLHVGLLSVAASFIQLTGYGSGFLRSWWQRCILGRDEFEAFKKNFYK